MKKLVTIFLFLLLLPVLKAIANTYESPNLPVSHCYHWLSEKSRRYLSFKYEHAAKNKNELTFHTTEESTNGAMAGPGLYCAKAPSGSYSYGDRVIKIEFVRDVVVLEEATGEQHCGLDGKFYATPEECREKPWDVKLYDRKNGWYLIRNPMAIARWSANSPELTEDLQKDSEAHGGDEFRERVKDTIGMIQEEVAKKKSRVYINGNARIDILKAIRENPKLLDSIPALHVLSEMIAKRSSELPQSLKIKYIRYSVSRALSDPQIQYSDMIPFLQDGQAAAEFFRIAKDLINIPRANQSMNSEALFMLYHDHGKKLSLAPEVVSSLLDKLVSSPVALKRLLSPDVKLNDIVKDQIKKKMEAGFARTQNAEALLAQRKFAITKFSDQNLAGQIKKNLSQRLSAMPTSKDFRLTLGKESYPVSPNLDQLLIQCKVYANLALEGKDNLDIFIDMPNRNFQFQLGSLRSSDNPDVFCQNKQANLKILIDALQAKSEAKKFFVSGRIEAATYFFVFEFFEDIEPQLTAFFNSQPTLDKMDEIYYSINGSAESRYYNSNDYWKQSQIVEAFRLIMFKAGMTSKTLYEEQKKLLKNKSKAHKHLKVSIQGTILDFYVASLEDLQKQCDKVMPHVANARVDKIRIAQVDSVNNEGKDLEYVENYNRNDYWETPETQCQAVRQTALKLPQPVFTQMQLDVLNNNSRKEFKVEARFQNILMQFIVDDIEEFANQCESLTDQMLSGIRVDLIVLKINGEELPKIYNRNDYWESTQEKCQQAKIALLGRILPKEIRKIQKIKSRYKHHLNVDLNSLKFNFYINNPEDLKYQCRISISHLGQSPKDKITITGMGADPLSSYNRESDWKGHEEICQEINRLVYEPKSE